MEKIKLAVLVGDLWGSMGEVGECRLRRVVEFSLDLAAVLRRMASCRFIEGDAVMAGGDFLVGDRDVDVAVGGITRECDFGRAGCEITTVGGEVDVGGEADVGEVKISDCLIGFCGASLLVDAFVSSLLVEFSTSACSGALGGSGLLLTDRSFTVCRREGVTTGEASSATGGMVLCSGLGWGSTLDTVGGSGMVSGAVGEDSSAFSGTGSVTSGVGGGGVSWATGLSVFKHFSSGGGCMGGGGGML